VTVVTSPQRKRDPKCLMILYWLDTESAYQRKSGPPGGRTQTQGLRFKRPPSPRRTIRL
jgi:hypothetical protein